MFALVWDQKKSVNNKLLLTDVLRFWTLIGAEPWPQGQIQALEGYFGHAIGPGRSKIEKLKVWMVFHSELLLKDQAHFPRHPLRSRLNRLYEFGEVIYAACIEHSRKLCFLSMMLAKIQKVMDSVSSSSKR